MGDPSAPKGRKAHKKREKHKRGKRKKAGILQTFPSANLIFLDQAVYSRCTQSPLPQEENMPTAKSWNIALHRGEREGASPEQMHWSFPQRFTSKAVQTFRRSPLRAPVGLTLLRADGRGRLSAGSRPAKPQWLPASVPAGVCSCLHDDLEPVLFSGAWHSECSRRRMQRSHTQQMHFSQQDALLLPGAAWELVRRWWESPWFVFLFFFLLLFSSRLRRLYPFLWQPVSPVSLASYLLQPSFFSPLSLFFS